MTRIAMLVYLAVCVNALATAGAFPKDSRLATLPTVSPTVCFNPAPFFIENWAPTSLSFLVALEDRLDDPTTIMKALARRHGFTIYQDHIYASRRGKRASFEVLWLTSTQVAALRCEVFVKHIEFNQLLILD